MKDFVPYYNEVLALIELGFDEFCFATIDQTDYVCIKGTKKPPRGSMMYDTIDCPTFSQVFRFFREKYRYFISINPIGHNITYFHYIITEKSNSLPKILDEEYSCYYGQIENTYEQAELECLRKLIEICKSK